VVPVAPAPAARHGKLRLVLGVVAVLAVLAGGGVLARAWVMQQYYVGASDGNVAIFQGVRGSVVGLPLQHVVERSDIALTDLPEATRNTVEDGLLVTEGGLRGARTRVDMLRGAMLVPCSALVAPPVQPSAAQPPAALPTAPAAAAPAPPVTDPNAPPPPITDPNAAAPTAVLPGFPLPGATAALPAPPGGDTTPLPTVTPEPGLNCRQGG
jgi:protein phosphatase